MRVTEVRHIYFYQGLHLTYQKIKLQKTLNMVCGGAGSVALSMGSHHVVWGGAVQGLGGGW